MSELQQRSLTLPADVWTAAETSAMYEDATVAEFVEQAVRLHAAISYSRRRGEQRGRPAAIPPAALPASALFAGTLSFMS